MPNHLIGETSPYLLQHAHNPVDWYPWGEEALARARAEDRPILLSVGYASCHWCHVMAHESFEDEAIARQMNEGFICVKVDREERPDLDDLYMTAVQALMGHGGWPLTAFLTPEGKPFYGGTYFPPENRGGMPAFPRVLDAVLDAYRNRRPEVDRAASALTESIQASVAPRPPSGAPDHGVLEQAFRGIAGAYDPEHGGFGRAPKFPQAMALTFLLRHHHRTRAPEALAMVEHSLEAMARGGIYDHLGGGFARYSTDAAWLVPHFEKMLYDNALLARLYVAAYQVTGRDAHRVVATETLDYLLRDLRHPDGGFFSSQDADSEGVEGKYYLWRPEEVTDALGRDDGELVNTYYGVSLEGNFEDGNVLYVPLGPEEIAPALGTSPEALAAQLAPLRRRLLGRRAQRIPPATDDKVLSAWNALAIHALAEAAPVLDEPRYREAAERAAAFVLDQLYTGGRLLRTWKDGTARLRAYLEDYALLVLALLALHGASLGQRWLFAARHLTDEMLELFWDEDGTWYDTGRDHEPLVVRPRGQFDNALPSGASAAAEALLRMGVLTGEARYRATAERLIAGVSEAMARLPLGFGNWLAAADLLLGTAQEVAIVAPDGAAGEFLRIAAGAYRPHLVLAGTDPGAPHAFPSPLLDGRGTIGDGPTAYVCRNYTCDLPTTDPALFRQQLDAPPA